MKPQPKDIVQIIQNNACGYTPNSNDETNCYLKPGDKVTVLEVMKGFLNKDDFEDEKEVVTYKVKGGGFRDLKTKAKHLGKMFLFIEDVKVVGVQCECNIWTGCTCGAIQREKLLKESDNA